MRKKIVISFIYLAICPLVAFSQHVGEAKSYPTAVVVDSLPSELNNTSSLFYWQDILWTANDHGGLMFYGLDTLNAAILRQLPALDTLPPFSDMEEVGQDDHYFYFGDFGNNHEYLRDDLRVLRLAKSDLLAGNFHFDTIFFTYEGYDPTLPGRNELPTTDFDCEAMIANADSLYLFTKQWTSLKTTCFVLPKEPGCYTALPRGEADVYGLVTGACYRPDQQLLVFVCYTPYCQPYLYLLYDFQGTDFFGGQQLRLPLTNGIGTQTEAIATADGLHYFLTNERLSLLGINCPPQLLSLDLSDYLGEYLHPDTTQVGLSPMPQQVAFSLSPNPATHQVEVSRPQPGVAAHLLIFNTQGRVLLEQEFPAHAKSQLIDIGGFPKGTYMLLISTEGGNTESHTFLVQ